MNYKDAVAYLDSIEQFGINPGLERIKALCGEIGNPQNSFPAIHITGTNGKTSTARLTAAILSAHGLKVGLYTSPHLCSYTERVSVDSELIPEEELASLLMYLLPVVERLEKKTHPDRFTLFEIFTALAFLYFHNVGIDCGVIEVGMGGRWDATNVVSSRVSVITNVELDHTDRLGATVEEITREKVGIVKEGSLVIAGKLHPRPLQIVQEWCERKGAVLNIVDRDFCLLSCRSRVCRQAGVNGFQKLSIKGLYGRYEDLKLPLIGHHQGVNLTLAVAAVEGFLKGTLSLDGLRRGLERVRCPGRLEIIVKFPTVVLDGAHNPSGAAELARALKSEFSCNNLILVLAILGDKDIDGILKELVPLASLVILSENQSYRSASVNVLMEKLAKFSSNFICEPDLFKAIEVAIERAGEGDLICITGSLYTVGEARDHFERLCGKNLELFQGKRL
ncbi:MAG: folylpolyglutamate synthase/dihydrofolate synthase family protein [Actinomycetota bacterium]|nr:folylpolyglutamate synthase/dihydrofolate synthase family protein [Actinomycetota bacterium]